MVHRSRDSEHREGQVMRVGTKSVLFGAHCFFLHPWFVALAWWQLFGFPWDPRLWVAFFVHDLGYLGKPNMDGPEGETHPELGATIMRIFDDAPYRIEQCEVECRFLSGAGFGFHRVRELEAQGWVFVCHRLHKALMKRPRYRWHDFALFHSRYYAKAVGGKPSKLCFADKLAFALTPRWLYLPMARATGELTEYLKNAQTAESSNWKGARYTAKAWHAALCKYMRDWVELHKDDAEDTWTRSDRHARDATGVWQ